MGKGKKHEWKIVQHNPIWKKDRSTFYIDVWFMDSNEIMRTNIKTIMNYSKNDFEKVTFAAYLTENLQDIEYFLKD